MREGHLAANRRAGPSEAESYCCPISRVGNVKVGLLTMTNLLPEMAMPTVVPPEEPVLKVPSEFKERVSEPATSAFWLRVEAVSVVLVRIPLLVRVKMPTSACAALADHFRSAHEVSSGQGSVGEARRLRFKGSQLNRGVRAKHEGGIKGIQIGNGRIGAATAAVQRHPANRDDGIGASRAASLARRPPISR